MKGQALADFVVECSILLTLEDHIDSKNEEDNRLWIVHIDRSSNEHGSGANVVLESHDEYSMKHSIIFGYEAADTAAEYEAILVGMDLAKTIKASRIFIKFDSRRVVGQSTGEC